MKANDYQAWSKKTAIYPKDESLSYIILGLLSEAGEVAGKYKKCIRDDGCILTDDRRNQMIDETGDIFWYLARLAEELGTTIEDILQKNHDKLEDRLARNVIKGSGDNR